MKRFNDKGKGFQLIDGIFREMDFDDGDEYIVSYDYIPAKDGQDSIISNYTVTKKEVNEE